MKESSNRLSRATISRLAFVAIRALEEGCKSGDHGPIERTATHRLALGYLMLAGIAAPGQAARLWELLGHEGVYEQLSCRQSHSGVMLDGMRERAAELGKA